MDAPAVDVGERLGKPLLGTFPTSYSVGFLTFRKLGCLGFRGI